MTHPIRDITDRAIDVINDQFHHNYGSFLDAQTEQRIAESIQTLLTQALLTPTK